MTEPDFDPEPRDPEEAESARPARRPSWLATTYGALGAIVLALYVLAGVMGWHFSSTERSEVPASVRQSPGGYRSHGFWYSGYQGGK